MAAGMEKCLWIIAGLGVGMVQNSRAKRNPTESNFMKTFLIV